ncbi:YajG family lipoprotein [Aliagarivorans marinus]|uniref:YajG family lipoprotein n=1 Tax=Aliagarivorans marinus TaxID=561965 RepID=UPI00040445EA|nr:YajG family lipoprotein [Aliagarivorans marinus]
MKPALRWLAALCCAGSLMACSSTPPPQLQLSPEVTVQQAEGEKASLIAALNSADLRNHRYLLSIHRDGQEQAELLASASNLRLDIEQQLKQAWQQQGLGFVTDSPFKLQVDILELVATAEQSSLKHQVESTMRLKVSLETPKRSLAKQYRSVHNNEGPLRLSLERQEEYLSAQLSELLTQIANDPQFFEVLENEQ